MAKRPPKQTHYERSEAYAKQVSGEIIEQIKKGTAPWQKPWKPGEQHSPSNIETGKAYTGGNSLYLMSRQIREGRGDNRWGTYRQIEAAGGQVRRGEKGTQVLFYQNRTERPAKDEEGKIRKDKEGHSTGHHGRMNRDTLKEGMAAGFGSPEYAREELRAEISAMMTGEQVGVGHDPQRGAAYVEHWVAVLEKDPHEIRRAGGDAQKMTNYLMDRAITQEREHPAKTKAELTQEFSHARGPQIGQAPKQPVAALTQAQERDRGPSR